MVGVKRERSGGGPGESTTRVRCGVVALLTFLGLFGGGCSADPAKQVATQIRAAASPVVRAVVYREANFLDPAEVDET